jgi:hypothetical protein
LKAKDVKELGKKEVVNHLDAHLTALNIPKDERPTVEHVVFIAGEGD